MSQRVAVYAGSFDPPTVGHLWMIKQGVELFDSLIVAVGINPAKQAYFSFNERLQMLAHAVNGLPHSRIRVEQYYNRYLVHYATEVGAQFILRGIRNMSDLEIELAMRQINADLAPNVTTVFLTPPREIAEISSSMVRGLVGPRGWEQVVSRYVPDMVLQKLKEKAYARKIA